jgi:hypothetical protein
MNNTKLCDINNSNNKIKQLWMLGDKHLVVIHKSIIEKLGITENSTVFLEQEVLQDNTILMRMKKL